MTNIELPGLGGFDAVYYPHGGQVEITLVPGDSDAVLVSIDDVAGPTHAAAAVIQAFTELGKQVAHRLETDNSPQLQAVRHHHHG